MGFTDFSGNAGKYSYRTHALGNGKKNERRTADYTDHMELQLFFDLSSLRRAMNLSYKNYFNEHSLNFHICPHTSKE